MVYGYARVSTRGQDRYGNGLDVQEAMLKENGAEVIYCESFTGTKKHRPELDKLMGQLKDGDTLIVCKLDRIARSARDGLDIIDDLLGREQRTKYIATKTLKRIDLLKKSILARAFRGELRNSFNKQEKSC